MSEDKRIETKSMVIISKRKRTLRDRRLNTKMKNFTANQKFNAVQSLGYQGCDLGEEKLGGYKDPDMSLPISKVSEYCYWHRVIWLLA